MRRIPPFELERYFARHEFSAPYLLSASDCEALTQSELLDMADGEARRLWKNLKLSYTESPGHPLLRHEIARIYRHIGDGDVLVTVPEEGIFLAMNAILEPGDHVICTSPAYQSLHAVAESIGCEVTLWQPDESEGWHFDAALLTGMIQQNTRLVIVNFPHNPTGFLPSSGAFRAMIEPIAEKGIWLFSDEMYRFLELTPGATLPSACDLYDKAITLSGLSKSFGLPGLRIGWLATRDRRLYKRIARLKDYTTICSSAPGEILAIIALRNRSTITEAHIARLRKNRQILDAFFEKHGNLFTWHRPSAGSVCFPGLKIREDSYPFCEEVVASAGIMIVPSRMFQYGERHIRIGFGRENFAAVLSLFSEFLDRQFNGTPSGQNGCGSRGNSP